MRNKNATYVRSNAAFAAGGSPSSKGSPGNGTPLFKVASDGFHPVVQVPKDQGEELRFHLAAHRIPAVVFSENPAFDRLEIEGDTAPKKVQAIVDEFRKYLKSANPKK